MERPLWKDFALLAAKSISTVITVVLIIVLSTLTIGALWKAESVISDGNCNIAVLPIEGAILPFAGLGGFDLVTTPQLVSDFITAAESDPSIEGVLIEINSPGGTPVASHRVAELLRDTTLPVVGLIGDMGASGGYMVAAATGFLIASPMSDVGSIGVNMSYVENSKQNEEEGLTYVQLIAGKFKDIGSPDRPITEEERELLQADLDLVHNEFIDIVSEYRDIPREAVVAIADGNSMPGRRAIEVDLIDALGGRTQAKAALAAMIDLTPNALEFCEYEAPLLPI